MAKTKGALKAYCEKTDGELLNTDLANYITDSVLSKIKRYHIGNEQYDTELFTETA